MRIREAQKHTDRNTVGSGSAVRKASIKADPKTPELTNLFKIPPSRNGRRNVMRGKKSWASCALPERFSSHKSSTWRWEFSVNTVSFPQIREYNCIAHRGGGLSRAGQVRTVCTLSYVGCEVTVNLCCGLAWKSCTYSQKSWDLGMQRKSHLKNYNCCTWAGCGLFWTVY